MVLDEVQLLLLVVVVAGRRPQQATSSLLLSRVEVFVAGQRTCTLRCPNYAWLVAERRLLARLQVVAGEIWILEGATVGQVSGLLMLLLLGTRRRRGRRGVQAQWLLVAGRARRFVVVVVCHH